MVEVTPVTKTSLKARTLAGSGKGKEKAKVADLTHDRPKKKQKVLEKGSLTDEEKGFGGTLWRAPKNPKKPSVRELTILVRLVHRQVAHVICPRTSGRTYMSHYDIFLTWAVLNGVEIDPTYIIVSHMYKATLKAKKGLPYAHHLCALLDDVGLTSLPRKTMRGV
ncbi:hypothetical protein Scep_007639 [Stephania cephalantha]|uniref:Uncharacterized protein n=1 Tax=Stephania cephalantha TaxID=152367 RepID=A0AAP0PLZ6_9MAGN